MPLHSGMSSSTCVATVMAATLVTSYALWTVHSTRSKRRLLKQKLPPNLDIWRIPGSDDDEDEDAEEQIWKFLDDVLRDEGYLQWTNIFASILESPGLSVPSSSGFGYAIPSRTEPNGIGTVKRSLLRFQCVNPLTRVARSRSGHDVMIRVIVIGNEGHEHLNILRRIAVGEDSLLCNNHTLPMFAEFQFEDIIFGVFPKVGASVQNAYDSWPKNSVGDIIEMLMQMLEALEFIHSLNISHRDAFRDNFVVQWHPESMRTMKISPSRPRVYLIDFEVAVAFPPEYKPDECLVTGFPSGGSFAGVERYGRAHAPEFSSGKVYSPFKLDVWQLGQSFWDFKSTIVPIDEILVDMITVDSTRRLSAKEALDRLQIVVHSMAPGSLLIEPVVTQKL